MSKIRVYELAKELGVENKHVITKAADLGIGGVRSHSNSLHAGDADQIRRAIIRQAIGTSPESEVVRTRVDKSTGEARTVVEKRKGNVIRRRRKSGAAVAKEETPDGLEQEVVPEVGSTENGSSPGGPVESATGSIDEQVFKKEFVDQEQDTSTAVDDGKVDAETAPVEGQKEEGLVSKVFRKATELVSPKDDSGAESVATEKKVVALEEGATTGTDGTGADGEEPKDLEKKKTLGPKVLGKIELPGTTATKRPEKEKKEKKRYRSSGAETATDTDVEEEGKERRGISRGKKAHVRRARKREFSRTELVDYEGSGPRRPNRTGKTARKAKEENQDETTSTELTTPKASKRIVKMEEVITVGEFASQVSLKASEVISKLIELGVMATINQVIDLDTATIVAEEFGFSVESTGFDEEIVLQVDEDKPEELEPRPPVVTVMGHVDHGKTSLLDSIRKTSVVDREHGGITQHIGAYRVVLPDGRSVAFIDTPGHAAFTAMRARGAHVTDIVILVVAADDGVMPQTLEAIDHAKAAGVPIVVAVNKMDKPDANPDKVKQQLAERGLQPEDWGGDTMFYPVSALQGSGLEELLEGILLQAEVAELKANPNRRAVGVIIEARQDKGRGTVATVLVQRGTLKVGDIYVTGGEFGRVRSMMDHLGQSVEEAGPSIPVEITGLSGVPDSGDDFVVVESEPRARQVAAHRAELKRRKEASALAGGPISLEEFSRRAREAKAAELNVIVKADVHGSLEAVRDGISKLSTEQVRVQVIHGGVGAVSESDVQLAIASKALLVGFNIRAENRAMMEAERHGVEVRFYRVIYELIDDVKSAMAGLLAPIRKENELGNAEVRDTFSVPKLGKVAGCYVTSGEVKRGSYVRLLRDNAVIHEGKMGSLRRFKDDVKEVQSGYECGISIDGFNDIKIGDVIQLYEIEEVAATLD